MSRLADPSLCPDCRGAVRPDATCSACGLALLGPLADRLWQTMLVADGLLEQLRAASPVEQRGGSAPRPSPRTATPRVPGRTVPALLLGLGGLLVFVAVSLFLAVTWSVLPLALKSLIMAGFTTAASAGAYALSRRGLRGSAEAIWALAGAVLALDLTAAYRSGLFGLDTVPPRTMTVAGGLLVVSFGVLVLLVVRRTVLRHSRAAEVVLLLATSVVVAAACWTGPASGGAGQVAGTAVLAAAAWGLHRCGCPLAAVGTGVLAVSTWLDLAVVGIVPGLDAATRSTYWDGFQGWPLLAAAVLAGLASLAPLAPSARVVASGASLVALSQLALLPWAARTTDVLVATGVLAVLAALTLLPATSWATASRWLAGVGAVIGGAVIVATSVLEGTLYALDHQQWRVPSAAPFENASDALLAAPWTLLVVLLATTTGLMAAAPRTRPTVLALLPTASAVTVASVLATSAAPVWSVGLALALGALLAGVTGARSPRVTGPVGAGAAVVLALVAVGVLSRCDAVTPRGGSLLVVAVAAAALLAAPWISRRADSRVVLEVGAVAMGVVAVLVTPDGYSAVAMTLTLLGSAAALGSVLRTDRTVLGWAGSLVLTIGTFVRLGDDGGVATELYAMPAAALLLLVGSRRLLHDRQRPTWRVLGPGLSLALLPSLVLALDDPGSLRTALVVVGAAVALGVGLERRWQAPFLYGVAVLTVLALRFLLPLAVDVLANPLGAWLLFGAAGAACLVTGVLWEHSLRNLRSARSFVGSLR